MRIELLPILALCGAVTYAFQNTSPFLAFEAYDPLAPRSIGLREASIESAPLLNSVLYDIVESCRPTAYVFVSQPSLTAQDFNDKDAMPHLRRLMMAANETMRWNLMYPEVIGSIDVSGMQERVTKMCKASSIDVDYANGYIKPSDEPRQIINLQFPTLSTIPETRASELLSHDSFLNTVLSSLKSKSRIVIYSTTPLNPASKDNSRQQYHSQSINFDEDNEAQSVLHMDLKRDLSSHMKRQNDTVPNAPLFETYAFFSPGLFMALFIGILLMSILYVGVTAIGSLEIPVAAFSKENGPAAQRKQ